MKFLIPLLALSLGCFAHAKEELVAKGVGYDKEGKEKKFTYERFVEKKGDLLHHRAVYIDLDGDVLTEEKMQTRDGRLIRYDMDQKQLKQKAWIEVDPKKKTVTYNFKKFRKNNYPQTAKLGDNFIMGLQIADFVRDHWKALSEGKEVEIGFGVWHRQETIKFDLTRDKSDDSSFVVKMSPSSMFIRAVVDPIYFIFDKKSKALTSYKGRTTPKEKRGRSFYDFDGLVKYTTIEKKSNDTNKKK